MSLKRICQHAMKKTGYLPSSSTSSLHAHDRLWPSFGPLRQKLLSLSSSGGVASLPESLTNSLLAMEQVKKAETNFQDNDNNSNGFDHKDEHNLHQIGVMTHTINTFLKQQINADQKTSEAVYTPQTLEVYDMAVWDFNAPFHWRIHPQEVQALYEQGLAQSKRHCEVAVGTGLFLKQWANNNRHKGGGETKECATPPPTRSATTRLEHLTLMDLSTSSLEGCYQRLHGVEYFQTGNYRTTVAIEKVQANIMEDPSTNLLGTFDSVAANFLLHCIHGESMEDKRAAIQGCAALLHADGVFFGSTILGKDLKADAKFAGPHAIATNQAYVELGIFGNRGDTFSDLAVILKDYFQDVDIIKVGYCAVWLAKGPK